LPRAEEGPLPCPHCAATAASEQARRAAPGDRTSRGPRRRRTGNGRTGTPFNHPPAPTAIVLRVVLGRLRYTPRRRERAEPARERGFDRTQEPVRDREARRAPPPTDRLRAKRRGAAGVEWPADEPSVEVNGTWRCRDRAGARAGPLGDARPGQTRARDAARRFFRRGRARAGGVPAQVPTDGHDASPRASRATPGPGGQHRTSRPKDTRIARGHRRVQQRCSPLRGRGRFVSAARGRAAFEGQRPSCRPVPRSGERVALAERRCRFRERRPAVMAELAAA